MNRGDDFQSQQVVAYSATPFGVGSAAMARGLITSKVSGALGLGIRWSAGRLADTNPVAVMAWVKGYFAGLRLGSSSS